MDLVVILCCQVRVTLDSAVLECDSARRERVQLGTSPAALIVTMHDTVHVLLATALSFAQVSEECPHRMIDVELDALLHLALLFFEEGDEDKALGFLRQHLQACVDVMHFMCRGCGRAQSKDAAMLTGVARFCHEKQQQVAAKKKGHIREAVLYKDICCLFQK